MKHLLTIWVMIGVFMTVVGITFLIVWLHEKARKYLEKHPKLEQILDRVGMLGTIILVSVVSIVGIVIVYVSIYQLL